MTDEHSFRPGLTVAVTGPTGDIGLPTLQRLDRNKAVKRIIGMARRPFDPTSMGLEKVEYRQGDITDHDSVEELVSGADVVVHLAFIILGGRDETQAINIEGSSNVFRATLASNARRLIYTSSVAAYGFHEDNPALLTEDVPPRGSEEHYYSAQKAELEHLLEDLAANSPVDIFVFRPCIVAGPSALSLIEEIPYVQISEKLPRAAQRVVEAVPMLRPVVPDPGIPFQLVHEDDVAQAIELAVVGKGEPGVYNLAGEGELMLSDLAHALGWYSLPVPDLAVDAAAKIVSSLPYMPAQASWINAIRVPVLMDCTRARTKLGWKPRYDALATLSDTVHAAREKGLLTALAKGRV